MFSVLLFSFCYFQSQPLSPAIKAKIQSIQSQEDFVRLVHQNREEINAKVQSFFDGAPLPEGVELHEFRVFISGAAQPELMPLDGLMTSRISDVDTLHYAITDLLKRGFPEADVPLLREIAKKGTVETFQAHFRRLSDQYLADAFINTEDYQVKGFKAFLQTEKGQTFITNKDYVREFLQAQDLAADKAMNLAMIDALSELQPQSLRVLMSYGYEVVTMGSTVSHGSVMKSDREVEWYINSIRNEK